MSRKKLDEGLFKKPGAPPQAAAANPATADRSVKAMIFKLPVYVGDQIRTRAFEERTTQRAVVLRALAVAGMEVFPEDLEDRRQGPAGREVS